MKRVAVALAAGLAASLLAVPGIASSKGKPPCTREVNVTFLVRGTLASAPSPPLTKSKHSYSGTLTVNVKSTNQEADALDHMNGVTFTAHNAHVTFAQKFKGGADAGDHVTLSGTVREPAKGCTGTPGAEPPPMTSISVAS